MALKVKHNFLVIMSNTRAQRVTDDSALRFDTITSKDHDSLLERRECRVCYNYYYSFMSALATGRTRAIRDAERRSGRRRRAAREKQSETGSCNNISASVFRADGARDERVAPM